MSSYAEFHRNSIDQRDAFWAEQARLIDWQTPPQQICDYSNPPFARWFVGGTTNLCHNAVDRHLKDRAGQAALVAISTETDSERSYSFAELHAEVQRMAQDSKAPLPMLVTLLKPSMLARELQLKNASAPMWTSFPPISSVFN